MSAVLKTLPPEAVLHGMDAPEPSPAEVADQVVRAVGAMTGLTRFSARGLARERFAEPPAGIVMIFVGRLRFYCAVPTAAAIIDRLGERAEGATLPARHRLAKVQQALHQAAHDAITAVELKLREARR